MADASIKLGLCIIAASLPFLAGAAVVCSNCGDTGKVTVKCPVCRGTKYMWKCIGTKYAQGTAVKLTDEDAFCGYGTTYHPLHSGCTSSKTRITCPMCISRSKVSSTGIVEMDCDLCDGNGHLLECVYVIRDSDLVYSAFSVPADEGSVPDGRSDKSNVFKCKMSTEDLEDYRTVYPRSRVFRSLALLRQFAEQKYTARRITVNRGGGPPNHGAPRRAIGGNSPRQFEAPPGGFERKPLSKEELDKIVEAENAHEREMIERKTSPRNKTVQQKAAPSGEL